jgi:hypothetical protein
MNNIPFFVRVGQLFTRLRETVNEDLQNYFRLRDKIEPKQRWKDFFFMIKSAGFVIIPAFLSGFIFLLLPQGKDTLLLVIEDMVSWKLGPFFFLLVGLVLWSGFSELAVRYAIAIADVSGNSLSEERVEWRKFLQKIFSEFFLFWPLIVLTIALVSCVVQASYMTAGTRVISSLILFLSMAVIVFGFSFFYLSWEPGEDGRTRLTFLGRHSITGEEKTWLSKLYGIYNEFVFSLSKGTNFKGKYRKLMDAFNGAVMTDEHLTSFPKDSEVMSSNRIIPEKFELINKDDIQSLAGGEFKWRYRIPPDFYAQLHRQLKIMIAIAVLLFLIMAFTPADCRTFAVIGAPALLCFAFASYTGIYSGLLYLDYVIFRRFRFSARLLLLVLFIVTSVTNDDHPVRMSRYHSAERNGLLKQFASWSRHYRRSLQGQDSAISDTDTIPVVFICAEGGALRTGAYTSIFLTALQHRMNDRKVDFKNSVFAMSGVSGGALGLGYYNAKAFNFQKYLPRSGSDTTDAKTFFLYDALSPVIGKMLFGDILNLFIPWHVNNFDRAIALEESWEQAYKNTLDTNENNRFAQSFIENKTDTLKPVLLINTTEIETGYQAWISNVVPDSMPRVRQRDLLAGKVSDVHYSTAVNFSTRFPLFSPGAEVPGIGNGRYHYLDGGYVENTGEGSMLELLNSLDKNAPAFKHIRPIVITLRFSEDENDGVKNIHVGNEVTEIVNGIYNARVGRSFMAMDALTSFVRSKHGLVIDEPLTAGEREVPMNWVLSEQSMTNLMNDINHKLADSTNGGICAKLANPNLHLLSTRAIHSIPLNVPPTKMAAIVKKARSAAVRGGFPVSPTGICQDCLLWENPYYLSIADTTKHMPRNTYTVYTREQFYERNKEKLDRTGSLATWGTVAGIKNENKVYIAANKQIKLAGDNALVQRGHCQPWIMQAYSKDAAIMSNTFTFNCAMAYATQNNGTEKKSEEIARDLVEGPNAKTDALQIWCGTSGKGKGYRAKGVNVTMPLYYYKILKYRDKAGNDKRQCFLMPNRPDQIKDSIIHCHITYEKLKQFLKFDPEQELTQSMLKNVQNTYAAN